MKKRTAVLLGCLLILSLAACGNPQEPQAAAQSNSIAASSQSESLADEGEDAAQAERKLSRGEMIFSVLWERSGVWGAQPRKN